LSKGFFFFLFFHTLLFGVKGNFFSSLDLYIGPDTFRGIPSGSWSGDCGALCGANGVFGYKEDKILLGAMVGASYGIYDWDGRGFSAATTLTEVEQQLFVSGNLFLGSTHPYGLDIAVGYDLMFPYNYGVFALAPFVDQVRAKFGITLNSNDQIGVWLTGFGRTSSNQIQQVPVSFKAIGQANAFWSHFFKNQSVLSVWAGGPYSSSLMYGTKNAGTYIVGAEFKAILAKDLSISGWWSYMGSSGTDPFSHASNFGNTIAFTLTYSIGQKYPRVFMGPANNSTFFVDSNTNQ